VVITVVTTTLQAFNLVPNKLYLKADMAKVKKHTTAVETSQIMDLSFFLEGGLIQLLGHVSPAAGTLCILNAQCRTVFSLFS
jgi:hypothetical protein